MGVGLRYAGAAGGVPLAIFATHFAQSVRSVFAIIAAICFLMSIFSWGACRSLQSVDDPDGAKPQSTDAPEDERGQRVRVARSFAHMALFGVCTEWLRGA